MRKGNSLKKMMAGVLSTAMIVGMLSGNAPMQVYAAGNAEAGDAAGRSAADEVAAESAGTEMSEADKTEPGNNGDQITNGQTTDMTGGAPEGGTTESGNGVSGEGTTGEVPPESSGESAGETSVETTTEPAEEDGILGDTVMDAETDNILTEETALVEEYPEGDAVVLAEHSHDGINYEPWTKTDRLPESEGYYYLTENVALTGRMRTIYGDIHICLNGKTVTLAEGVDKEPVIFIQQDTILNLYDCAGGGNITGGQYSGIQNGGTLIMYGGAIKDNETPNMGGGVYNDGIFYMYGGEISHNTSYDGTAGGVANLNKFYMYGGKITNNVSTGPYSSCAGGVWSGRDFYMYGGEISGNLSMYAGGVGWSMLDNVNGTFTVGGTAVVTGNKDVYGNDNNVEFLFATTVAVDHSKPLANGANIGVTLFLLQDPEEGDAINVTGANPTDYSAYFHSDNPDYIVQNGADHAVLIVVPGSHTHQWADTWGNDADHHWHNCTVPGCWITNNADKNNYALHTEDSGTVTKEPTETEEGVRTYKCSICGYEMRTEAIPAAGDGDDKTDEGKPGDGTDDKPDNGGGGEHPDDNNQSEDNPPENNTVGGSDSVINDQIGVPIETESAGASEEVIDAETDTPRSGEDVSSMETPAVIPEQPGDPEPKTADVRPVELYATLAMISGLIYVLLYFADRNGGMTEETKKELVFRLIRWAKRGKSIRRMIALAAIFMLLVYYHSIGKQGGIEWKEAC